MAAIDDQYLTLKIDDEDYAVEIGVVQEIRSMPGAFTSLPDAPRFVRGVINLRGVIIPVYDLRARFGLPKLEDERFAVIAVLEYEHRIVGLIVDGVSDVLTIPEPSAQACGMVGAETSTPLIRCVAHVSDRLVALLNLSAVFSREYSAPCGVPATFSSEEAR